VVDGALFYTMAGGRWEMRTARLTHRPADAGSSADAPPG
jgi:hypothetical protein